MTGSGRAAELEAALRERVPASHVEVVDESHLHAGHPGAASGGGHFRVLVVAEAFAGLATLERQRRVYAALRQEMKSWIHALAMRTLTPEEWRSPAAPATREGPG